MPQRKGARKNTRAKQQLQERRRKAAQVAKMTRRATKDIYSVEYPTANNPVAWFEEPVLVQEIKPHPYLGEERNLTGPARLPAQQYTARMLSVSIPYSTLGTPPDHHLFQVRIHVEHVQGERMQHTYLVCVPRCPTPMEYISVLCDEIAQWNKLVIQQSAFAMRMQIYYEMNQVNKTWANVDMEVIAKRQQRGKNRVRIYGGTSEWW